MIIFHFKERFFFGGGGGGGGVGVGGLIFLAKGESLQRPPSLCHTCSWIKKLFIHPPEGWLRKKRFFLFSLLHQVHRT